MAKYGSEVCTGQLSLKVILLSVLACLLASCREPETSVNAVRVSPGNLYIVVERDQVFGDGAWGAGAVHQICIEKIGDSKSFRVVYSVDAAEFGTNNIRAEWENSKALTIYDTERSLAKGIRNDFPLIRISFQSH